MRHRYWLVIVWDNGKREEYGYDTKETASRAARGYRAACSNIRCCYVIVRI